MKTRGRHYHCRGQAMTEYVIVVLFCAVGLILVREPSPVAQLVAAIKGFFSAYAYAISVTS
jgi:Flp pilus assembly pilin Flp